MANPNRNHPDPTAGPARLLHQEVWSRGDLALVDELVAEGYVHHDPVLSDPVEGPAEFERTVARYREGLPDLTKRVEAAFERAEAAVVVYEFTGTHEGALLGVESTGREVAVDGAYVCRTNDGRLVDGTDVWDAYGLLAQLGALPESLAVHEPDREP